MSFLIFLYIVDKEFVDSSEMLINNSQSKLMLKIDMIIKLLLFFSLSDECIILSPTFVCESDLAYDVCATHRELIDAGYIKDYKKEDNYSDFAEKKLTNYKRDFHVLDITQFYKKERIDRLRKLGFSTESKRIKVGETSLSLFTEIFTQRVKAFGYNLDDLVKRICDSEQNSFLWESVKIQCDKCGIDARLAKELGIRGLMNNVFIETYRQEKIKIPINTGLLANPILTSDITTNYIDCEELKKYANWIGIYNILAEMDQNSFVDLLNDFDHVALMLIFLSELNILSYQNIETKVKAFDKLKRNGVIDSIKNLTLKYRIKGKGKIMNGKERKVFVIYGRNLHLKEQLFLFLSAARLDPFEWEQAVRLTGKGSPTILEVIQAGMEHSQAIIALYSDDEKVELREELCGGKSNEEGYQPRPNVIFESGLAYGMYPENTVLIRHGVVRDFSDVSGLHYLNLDDSLESRQNILTRLNSLGCKADISGTLWHKAGDLKSNW